MYDPIPMTIQRRQQVILVVFLFMVGVYLFCEYVSVPKFYDGKFYISRTTSENLTEEFIQEYTLITESENNFKRVVDEQKPEDTSNFNVSVSVVSTENGKILRVEYDKMATSSQGKMVFANMEEITKSATNIIFLETRCSTEKGAKDYVNNKGFILNARQCCAIESTALTNLDKDVYVFHSCPLSVDFLDFSPRYVQKLFRYPNVRVIVMNSTEVFKGSPIQELHEKKLLETSQYPIEHTSDILRLTLLWKFGGSYFDLDVVNIRSVSALGFNWAGAQDHETVANGVLNFEPSGVGHEIIRQSLDYINNHFDPTNWSTNGPLLITPFILKECKVKTVKEAWHQCNGNFTVFDPSVFYPLYYPAAGYFFDQTRGRQIVDEVKNKSFSVHIWNKMTRDMAGVVGSTQAYALLADEFCPEVYRSCGTNF